MKKNPEAPKGPEDRAKNDPNEVFELCARHGKMRYVVFNKPDLDGNNPIEGTPVKFWVCDGCEEEKEFFGFTWQKSPEVLRKQMEEQERFWYLSMNAPSYADLRGTAAWELFTHTHKREARAVLKWEREADKLDRKVNWWKYEHWTGRI